MLAVSACLALVICVWQPVFVWHLTCVFAVSAHLALDVGVGCQCWHVISAGAWRVAVVKFKTFPFSYGVSGYKLACCIPNWCHREFGTPRNTASPT